MTVTKRRHQGRLIDTSVSIDATPMRVWEAWADPAKIANWFVDRAEGSAKPGEVMTWMFDTFNYKMPVPIIEAEPGRTFVTGSGDAPGPQGLPYLMEITIERSGGTTVMRLLNSGFSEDAKFDDEYDGVVSGWLCALAMMKRWLEEYPERRRTHRIVMEPSAYTFDRLRPLFATTEGRRRWLAPAIPADSSVLVDSGREVLLAWDAREAVVGLKAFRMGPQPMLALDFSTWASEPGDLAGTLDDLRQALGRLKPLLT